MTAPVVDARPLVDAIEAAVIAGGVLFGDGVKPANVGTKPYVVAFFDGGTVDDRSLKSRDGWVLTGTFHCSGLTPDSARIAVRGLRSAILGLRGAVIDGRTVQMPVHLTGAPMTRDDDADPPLFIQVDEWRIRTSA